MKIKNINDLYMNLIKNCRIKPFVKLFNNNIEIIPYKTLNIRIVENQYFDLYVNNLFYYSIENEEIYDFIQEFAENKFVFIKEILKNNKIIIKTIATKNYQKNEQIALKENILNIYSFQNQIK